MGKAAIPFLKLLLSRQNFFELHKMQVAIYFLLVIILSAELGNACEVANDPKIRCKAFLAEAKKRAMNEVTKKSHMTETKKSHKMETKKSHMTKKKEILA